MSFEIFITCDDSECNSRIQVPQVGQLPNGWVFLQYPMMLSTADLLAGRQGGRNGQPVGQMISKTFCGWRCANKQTKQFVQEAAKK